MLPPDSSREDNVYMAKLAEQDERYEEMVEFMEKVAKYNTKAAVAAGLTVAEVTGINVVSVAEDELMRILILVRNFLPGYHQVINGEWNVTGIEHRAYDLERKTVGTIGAGRIGRLLLQRLKTFNCNLLYHDRIKMDQELENQTGAKFEEDLDAMLPKCDIIVINMPLTEKTK